MQMADAEGSDQVISLHHCLPKEPYNPTSFLRTTDPEFWLFDLEARGLRRESNVLRVLLQVMNIEDPNLRLQTLQTLREKRGRRRPSLGNLASMAGWIAKRGVTSYMSWYHLADQIWNLFFKNHSELQF